MIMVAKDLLESLGIKVYNDPDTMDRHDDRVTGKVNGRHQMDCGLLNKYASVGNQLLYSEYNHCNSICATS